MLHLLPSSAALAGCCACWCRCVQIDRIVYEHKQARQPSQYLVKWCGLEYSDATWELEEEICRDGAGQVGCSHPV